MDGSLQQEWTIVRFLSHKEIYDLKEAFSMEMPTEYPNLVQDLQLLRDDMVALW